MNKLSKRLVNSIIKTLTQNGPMTVYWNHDQEIDPLFIYKAIQKHKQQALEFIEEGIRNLNDHWWNYEISMLENALKEHSADIEHALKNNAIDYRKMAEELRDDFLDYLDINENFEKAFPKIPVRIVMVSNYDCINSHHFESTSRGYLGRESYFSDVMKILKLNPAEMKEIFESKEIPVYDRWPSFPTRKPYVDMYEFIRLEVEERSCPACLLTFLGMVDSYEYLNMYAQHGDDLMITIPEGNSCGFYSSWQGGGSMIETPLIRPMTINLNKNYDGHGLGFRLILDSEEYSIKSAYGVVLSYFGNTISIEKAKNPRKLKTVH